MSFTIKTEDEQRLDHIRELVESCEKELKCISRSPIPDADKLTESRVQMLCTIRSIGGVVDVRGPGA